MTFYNLVRYGARPFFRMLFRVKVAGTQNVPRRGGFILAANHASYLDPLIAGFTCPRALDFMARHDLFSNFFFGMLIRALNAFPIKRSGGNTGAMAVAVGRVRRGRALVVFPEGTRSATGELKPPHRGIAYLADATGVPVVPCYIKGSNEAWGVNSKAVKFVPLSIYFGRTMKYANGQDYREFAQSVMREIARMKERGNAG